MKGIGEYKEAKILKLFLGGFSYDEIAQQVGVSHGSVANTVDEFRNGDLPVPPGMTEYVDELRHLVVDMKKEHTTPAQVKSCLNIHKKLLKMGVDTTQVEQWLDISQDIASTADSDKQFVESALELAQLTGDTGLSCKAAVDSYHAMMKASEALDIDMQQKSKKLEVFDLNYEKKKKQASKELESINTAIATAQDNFAQQEAQLKAQMDEYLAQNKLTWKKVKTATALLDSGLADAGLNKEEIEELSERLEAAGSLAVTINELKKQRDELKPEVELLAKQKGDYSDIVGQLQDMHANLTKAIAEKGDQSAKLDVQIIFKKNELDTLEKGIEYIAEAMSVTYVITSFLCDPNSLNKYDFDYLVNLMVGLRQVRLGVGPKLVKDANGKVICSCQVPELHWKTPLEEKDMEHARERLAFLLMPLVKTEFVPKVWHDILKIQLGIDNLKL